MKVTSEGSTTRLSIGVKSGHSILERIGFNKTELDSLRTIHGAGCEGAWGSIIPAE